MVGGRWSALVAIQLQPYLPYLEDEGISEEQERVGGCTEQR